MWLSLINTAAVDAAYHLNASIRASALDTKICKNIFRRNCDILIIIHIIIMIFSRETATVQYQR